MQVNESQVFEIIALCTFTTRIIDITDNLEHTPFRNTKLVKNLKNVTLPYLEAIRQGWQVVLESDATGQLESYFQDYEKAFELALQLLANFNPIDIADVLACLNELRQMEKKELSISHVLLEVLRNGEVEIQ